MPGHAVQVNVKFVAPLTTANRKKYYQFSAIDDCTRLRVLRIYDRLNEKTAIAADRRCGSSSSGWAPAHDRDGGIAGQ